MARRGASGPQSLLPLAAVTAVLFFLAVLVLKVHSGSNPGSNQAATPPPSPSASSPSARGSSSASSRPSATPGAVSPSAVSPAPASSQPGVAGAGSGSGSAPGAGPAAGGQTPMPNTGAPFPWWMGLLPVSLGIGLTRALRRDPEPVPSGTGAGRAGRVRRQASRPPLRPASGQGRRRP